MRSKIVTVFTEAIANAKVPALDVVLHRSVWSLLFVLVALAVLRRWSWVLPLLRQPRQLLIYGVSALLIAGNMVFAIALVHMGQLGQLNDQGGWAIELQALMLFGAIASMLLGPGKPAVNDK